MHCRTWPICLKYENIPSKSIFSEKHTGSSTTSWTKLNYYWAFFMQVGSCLKVVLKSWYEKNWYFSGQMRVPRPTFPRNYSFLREVGVVPSWQCHALVPPAPKSWVLGLSYEVLLASVTEMVPSESGQEYQKRIFLVN